MTASSLGWLQTPAGMIAAFILGALFGSFANVCIYRWPPSDKFPAGRSVTLPASHCFACQTPIKWYDNVPLLSFLWLRGRCRHCGVEFSARYLWVEFIGGALFAAMHHITFAEPGFVGLAGLIHFVVLATFAFFMLVIAFIDLDHKLILDKLTYPAIPVMFMLGCFTFVPELLSRAIGIVVGYLLIATISKVYYALTKRSGLGIGDGKLLALIGALLGWPAVLASLFFGSLSGIAVSLPVLLLSRQKGDTSIRHVAIPFGPFLAFGGLVYCWLYFREPQWLMHWLNPEWLQPTRIVDILS